MKRFSVVFLGAFLLTPALAWAAPSAPPRAAPPGQPSAVRAPVAPPAAEPLVATAIRRGSAEMVDKIHLATSSTPDPVALTYVKTNLSKDVSVLTKALENLHQRERLDPITEQRAMAAASRVILAADKAGASIEAGDRDKIESLLSGARYRFLSDHHDTAVETEVSRTWGVINALGTSDGTIGPILKAGGKAPPDFIKAMAKDRAQEKIGFDELSAQQKLELLQSQSKGWSFFSDRRIPGVIFRDGYDVSGGLQKKVEFRGPTEVDQISGIEFHVRKSGPASGTLQEAANTDAKLGVSADSRHEHIPVRIPTTVLGGDNVDRFRLVDFYRRTNTTAELRSVLDGYILKPVKTTDAIYFDFLRADSLGQMNSHLDSVARTGRPTLRNSSLKMAAVGFRTGEMYGDDKMMGFEVRTLHINDAKGAGEWKPFVDAVQKGLLTNSYGRVTRAAAAEYHDRVVGTSGNIVGKENAVLIGLHYNRAIDTLIKEAPEGLKASLTPEVKKALETFSPTAYGVKMLVHDWGKDPVVAGDPALKARIEGAQQKFLGQLGALPVGTDDASLRPVHGIVKAFVKESALYEAFSASIGMRDVPTAN